MNKIIKNLILLTLFISITFNIYLITSSNYSEKKYDILIEDNFIYVIKDIIKKIENKNITQIQKEKYKNKLIEVIKKYPK